MSLCSNQLAEMQDMVNVAVVIMGISLVLLSVAHVLNHLCYFGWETGLLHRRLGYLAIAVLEKAQACQSLGNTEYRYAACHQSQTIQGLLGVNA
jgi:hypothetical protein